MSEQFLHQTYRVRVLLRCVNLYHQVEKQVAAHWQQLQKEGKVDAEYGMGWSPLPGKPEVILKTSHSKSGSKWTINLIDTPRVGARSGRQLSLKVSMNESDHFALLLSDNMT